jgi:hypothetical protein
VPPGRRSSTTRPGRDHGHLDQRAFREAGGFGPNDRIDLAHRPQAPADDPHHDGDVELLEVTHETGHAGDFLGRAAKCRAAAQV